MNYKYEFERLLDVCKQLTNNFESKAARTVLINAIKHYESVPAETRVMPKIADEERYYYKTSQHSESLCMEPCRLRESKIMIGSALCMECDNNITEKRKYIKCKKIEEAIG